MKRYRFTMQGEGVALETTRTHLWARCKSRKAHRCVVCNGTTQKGARVYRPISEGNGTKRYERACTPCVQGFLKADAW